MRRIEDLGHTVWPIPSSALPAKTQRSCLTKYVLELRAKLKQKALGNETVVERLIQYEHTRNPNGHMELWVQAAIDRWEHDNRSHR